MPAAPRGYSAARFTLEIEGQFAGWLTSVEGGEIYGVVAEQDVNGSIDKSISGTAYDDIVVTCGLPEPALMDWLTGFLSGTAPDKNGAVVFYDFNYREESRLEWKNGVIAAVTLPALDAAAGKDAVGLVVTITPESTRTTKGGGGSVASGSKNVARKAWVGSNFNVSIPNVSCTKVSSVEALTISQAHDPEPIGDTRAVRKAGPLLVGDLVLGVAASGAADFVTWLDSSVGGGNREKTATIRYLSPNLQDELMTVELTGVGIHRLDSARAVTGASVVARKHASMYCEQAGLTIPKTQPASRAAATTPAPSPAAKDKADLRDVLGDRLTPGEVARRLRAPLASRTSLSVVDEQRRLGYDLGVAWAERRASLDELEELAAVDHQRDWSAIALPPDHSLGETLEASGIVERPSDGRLELTRDSLAEGLLAGILAVSSELAADITANLK